MLLCSDVFDEREAAGRALPGCSIARHAHSWPCSHAPPPTLRSFLFHPASFVLSAAVVLCQSTAHSSTSCVSHSSCLLLAMFMFIISIACRRRLSCAGPRTPTASGCTSRASSTAWASCWRTGGGAASRSGRCAGSRSPWAAALTRTSRARSSSWQTPIAGGARATRRLATLRGA